jgi:ankyrin repeat protein
MNIDTFLEIVKKSDLIDIKNLCESNKLFNVFCKENKEYIYRHLIKRDFPGRESESNENKYKRLLDYKNNPDGSHSLLSQWYNGIDQEYRFLQRKTYLDINILNQFLKTNPKYPVIKDSYDGWTPLMVAIRHKPDLNIHSSIFALVEKYADLNSQNKDGWTPLMIAIRYSNKEVILRLLEKDSDMNAKDSDGWTALIFAIHYSTLDIINKILEKNIDLNVPSNDTKTPLLHALQYSTPDVINSILEKGADVNAKNSENTTPLHLAIQRSTPDVIDSILEKGADVNAKNSDNTTPLHMAIQWSTPDVIYRLLEKGAGINTRGFNGNTSLILALQFSTPDVINRLLDMGADPNIKNDDGTSISKVAAINSTPDIISRIDNMIRDSLPQFDNILGTIYKGYLQLNITKDGKNYKKKCRDIPMEQLLNISKYLDIQTSGNRRELCNDIQKVLSDTGRMN